MKILLKKKINIPITVSSQNVLPMLMVPKESISPSPSPLSSPSKPVQLPKGPASEWQIEDVIQFITAHDAKLAENYADLFRKHVSEFVASLSSLITSLICFYSIFFYHRKLMAKPCFCSTPMQ